MKIPRNRPHYLRWRIEASLVLSALAGAAEAVPLDTLFARGDSSIAVTWTADSANTRADWYRANGALCTDADSVYTHCDFLPGVTYRSIAYSYGGEDGYVRFREKIAAGFLAGSHLCHYTTFGDPSPVVAGTDCSGFVCFLWDVPRVSTRELYSGYAVITREELDAGDILVKPGSHTVLIVEKEEDTRFLIWESTSAVNGCRQRSIDIADSYWDAYYPRRHSGITGAIPLATDCTHRNGFPDVTMHREGSILRCAPAWQGTVSFYSLRGARLATRHLAAGTGGAIRIHMQPAAGVRIVDIRAGDGSAKTGLTRIIR